MFQGIVRIILGKDVVCLVTCVGQRKNFELLRGIEPRTSQKQRLYMVGKAY